MMERIYRFFMIEQAEREKFPYFLLIFMLLGCGMALGRGSSEALFFKRFGLENLPHTYIAQGIALFFVCLVYVTVVDRISSERLFKYINNALLSALIICWLMMSFWANEYVYPTYYLLYEISSDIILIHSTLYLSQNLDSQQIKRLIPIILGGMQLGSIIGGSVLLISSQFLAVEHVLLLWILTLIGVKTLLSQYHKRFGISPYFRPMRRGQALLTQSLQQIRESLSFARYSSLLKYILLAMFFMVISFYIIHYATNQIYIDYFDSEKTLASFYGALCIITGLIALFFQFFITNKLIYRKGIRVVNLIFPLFVIASFMLFNLSFALPAALFASFTKDSVMTGFRNPVHNLFYNALPNRIQGRSRALSVGLILPIALILTGLFLYLTQHGLSTQSYLLIGTAASLAYFLFSQKMNATYSNSIIKNLRRKLFIPDRDINQLTDDKDDKKTFDILCRATRHAEPEIRFIAVSNLLKLNPLRAISTVLDAMTSMSIPHRDQLIKEMMPLRTDKIKGQLWSDIREGDDHLRSTALRALFNLKDDEAKSMIRSSIQNKSPRICATGIFGALHYPIPSLQEEALTIWKDLLNNNDLSHIMAGIELLAFYPRSEFTPMLVTLIEINNPRVQFLCMSALANCPKNNLHQLKPLLNKLSVHNSPKMRETALKTLSKIDIENTHILARASFEDEHPDVRIIAAEVFFNSPCCVISIVDWLMTSQASPRAQSSVLDTLMRQEPDLPTLRKIAYKKARDASLFFDARDHLASYLDKDNKAVEVLNLLLNERASQLLDLSLFAISVCEDPTTVSVIRAGLISKDSQHNANALEVLEDFSDQTLSKMLLSILSKMKKHPENEKHDSDYPFHNLNEMINWCCSFDDPWLLTCANEVKTQTHA